MSTDLLDFEKEIDEQVVAGNSNAVVKLIKEIALEKRKSLSKKSAKTLKDIFEYRFNANISDADRKLYRKQEEAALVYLYSCSPLSSIKKLGWRAVPDYEIAVLILKNFEPEWVQEWCEWLVEAAPRNFNLIRQLMADGLVNQPKSENYILGMITSLGAGAHREKKLIDFLRGEASLLENEVWRIFSVEGNGEFSLAANDKYTSEDWSWSQTLINLSEEGEISRDRLLDESLVTLSKDFAQFRSGWYSRFHEALKPTDEERIARVDRYLDLLGSQIPPTVTFAIKALAQINKNKELTVEHYINNFLPALEAKTKSTVMQALRIAESLLKLSSENANEVLILCSHSLISDNSDVQKKVFDLLDKYGNDGDEEIGNVVDLNIDNILPSLKSRASNWLNEQDQFQHEEEEIVEIPSQESIVCRSIEPIRTIEDLIESFSLVLEDATDAIELERVLDGLLRLKYKPEDFDKLVGPLRKRAKALIKRGNEDWLTYQLSVLALSFTTQRNQFMNPDGFSYSQKTWATIHEYLLPRFQYIACLLLNDRELPLLSLPTHGRAFLSPEALLARYKEYNEKDVKPPVIEMVLSILRMDLDDKAIAEDMFLLIDGEHEFVDAIKFALGFDVQIGDTKALWITAACKRSPTAICQPVFEKFGDLGPDAGQSVKYTPSVKVESSDTYTWYFLQVHISPKIPGKVPPEHLSVLFYSRGGYYYSTGTMGEFANVVCWASTVWPDNLEPFFCDGARSIDIDWSEAQWQVSSYFSPMLEPDAPMNDMALLLLANGLGAVEPGQKGIATDVFIACINDGRLDINRLADCMADLLPTGYIKVARWTKTLKDIASVSSIHLSAVVDLIQNMLRHDPDDAPRDLGGMLELLYELLVASNGKISNEDAINYLKSNKKGGKQGKYSKLLCKEYI
ncbi:MAG: DUF6493 family protein [Candidatus Thiodiazotropha sp. 4PDIV1]